MIKIQKVNYQDINFKISGDYLLETGEYLSISSLGSQYFYKDESFAVIHRDGNLPAIIYSDRLEYYMYESKLHRTNGPAKFYYNRSRHGEEIYYLCGISYSEKDYNDLLLMIKNNNISIDDYFKNLEIIE